eukprot:6363707-Prymnesium_polylepis.1
MMPPTALLYPPRAVAGEAILVDALVPRPIRARDGERRGALLAVRRRLGAAAAERAVARRHLPRGRDRRTARVRGVRVQRAHEEAVVDAVQRRVQPHTCLLYTSPSPRDAHES